jgi:hypothetical protein
MIRTLSHAGTSLLRSLSAVTGIATVATATAVLAAAVPALAASGSQLTLSVTADAGWARAVVLWCGPAGGPHPSAGQACAALKTVDGHIRRLEPAQTVCTLQLAPVTAAATGSWKGRKVSFSHTYGNTCEMTRATGVIFRF